MKAPSRLSEEAAEEIAVQALSFIAADPERLDRFLAITGIGPDEIRAAAAAPGFMLGVLDYVASDDRLIGAFAADSGLAPALIARAHAALGGAPWEREMP